MDNFKIGIFLFILLLAVSTSSWFANLTHELDLTHEYIAKLETRISVLEEVTLDNLQEEYNDEQVYTPEVIR